MERKNAQYQEAGIRAVEMKIDCGDLVVTETEGITQISIQAEVDEQDCYEEYVDNGVLKIRYKLKKRWFNVGNNKISISLQLPKGKTFERFALEVGAGNADLSGIRPVCDRMKLEVGAGNIEMTGAEITDRLDVEIGAGNINLRNATVANVNVECGVGNCSLGLAGKETDYNYKVACGVGKIRINDNCMKQIGGSEVRKNAGAIGNIELECGVGKIELHTAE